MLSTARRAALKLHVPIGFCDADDGRMVLDPNRQVQDTIRLLLRTCRRTRSASATGRAWRQAHVPFPRRVRSGPHQGELGWGDLQHHAVRRLLHHPCDAGALVFGRTRTSTTADGRTPIAALPREGLCLKSQFCTRFIYFSYV
jgi:hypothetical protein